jgi:hypothetical protein
MTVNDIDWFDVFLWVVFIGLFLGLVVEVAK